MNTSKHLVVAPKQDVDPTAPSHVPGVHQGNRPTAAAKRASGIEVYAHWAFATPRRSTGICADDRRPIDPASPVLTPA